MYRGLCFVAVAFALVACDSVSRSTAPAPSSDPHASLSSASAPTIAIVDLGTNPFPFDGNGINGGVLLASGAASALDIGTLGGSYSRAFAINKFQNIVGFSLTAQSDFHAF